MIHWLGSLPAIALFPLFGAIGIGLTVLFDAVMRRHVTPETRQRASPTASVTMQVTATIYAILIAFVIVDAYTQLRESQSEVSTKASSLGVIFENSRGLPEPVAGEVRDAALAYARTVVERGIPRLEDSGQPDRVTDQALESLYRTVQHVHVTDEDQRVAFEATVRSLDSIVATRAQLIDAARASVPSTLLWLLVVIGVTVMAVATLLDTQHRRSHLFILSALALVIWLTLALVVSLDYPFSGIIRVTDSPIREFIDFRAAR